MKIDKLLDRHIPCIHENCMDGKYIAYGQVVTCLYCAGFREPMKNFIIETFKDIFRDVLARKTVSADFGAVLGEEVVSVEAIEEVLEEYGINL